MAKVTAIHIDNNGFYKYYLNTGYMLSYVKSKGHEVEFYLGESGISVRDSAKEIMKQKPNCVIFLLAKYNYNISISLAAELKKICRELTIIAGGFFAAGNADLLLGKFNFFDMCFLSEGEFSLLKTLENIDQKKRIFEDNNHIAYFDEKLNKVIKISSVGNQIDLNQIPSPYNEIINPVLMNEQYGCIYISSSRGCKFECTYCFHPLLRKKIRHFNQMHVVNEIKAISECFTLNDEILIDFWDDFFISDRDYTLSLCKLIQNEKNNFKCKIKIKVDTRIDYIDEELLINMAKANFYFIGFGLENSNLRILKEMNKLGNCVTDEECRNFLLKFQPILTKCRQLGIKTGLYIIHGWLNETLRMAKRTLAFAEKLEPDEIHQHQLAYFKGAKIYPKKYEDDFYLYFNKNPELYKFNLDKIPDSKLDPFIEHYRANYKFLIETGIQYNQQKMVNTNLFQNMIFESHLNGKYIYENCKMNSSVSVYNENKKELSIQSTPLYDSRYDNDIDLKKAFSMADKWHHSGKNLPYLIPEKRRITFFNINLNKKFLKKMIISKKTTYVPCDICSISNKCACEDNYRIFVGKDSYLYTCKNGIKLGSQDDSAERILENYRNIKSENESIFGCELCNFKEKCSKCPKMLNKYGKRYCDFIAQNNFSSCENYLKYLEKRFYYERLDNSKDFYFVKK